jgi:histidinol-phosphatase
VTLADREAEAVIRQRIGRSFPQHAILGEEQGASGAAGRYRWIIDPIDGTKTFMRGVPLYGVLVAVEVDGEPAVGVVDMPALGETVWATHNGGCFCNGRPARVSSTDRLADATLLVTSTTAAMARSAAYGRLAAATKLHRTWGDCYGYVLVATGRADIMLDPVVAPWDCAPLLPILREAGGHFSTWAGEVTIWGRDAMACNAALRDDVLRMLADG